MSLPELPETKTEVTSSTMDNQSDISQSELSETKMEVSRTMDSHSELPETKTEVTPSTMSNQSDISQSELSETKTEVSRTMDSHSELPETKTEVTSSTMDMSNQSDISQSELSETKTEVSPTMDSHSEVSQSKISETKTEMTLWIMGDHPDTSHTETPQITAHTISCSMIKQIDMSHSEISEPASEMTSCIMKDQPDPFNPAVPETEMDMTVGIVDLHNKIYQQEGNYSTLGVCSSLSHESNPETPETYSDAMFRKMDRDECTDGVQGDTACVIEQEHLYDELQNQGENLYETLRYKSKATQEIGSGEMVAVYETTTVLIKPKPAHLSSGRKSLKTRAQNFFRVSQRNKGVDCNEVNATFLSSKRKESVLKEFLLSSLNLGISNSQGKLAPSGKSVVDRSLTLHSSSDSPVYRLSVGSASPTPSPSPSFNGVSRVKGAEPQPVPEDARSVVTDMDDSDNKDIHTTSLLKSTRDKRVPHLPTFLKSRPQRISEQLQYYRQQRPTKCFKCVGICLVLAIIIAAVTLAVTKPYFTGITGEPINSDRKTNDNLNFLNLALTVPSSVDPGEKMAISCLASNRSAPPVTNQTVSNPKNVNMMSIIQFKSDGTHNIVAQDPESSSTSVHKRPGLTVSRTNSGLDSQLTLTVDHASCLDSGLYACVINVTVGNSETRCLMSSNQSVSVKHCQMARAADTQTNFQLELKITPSRITETTINTSVKITCSLPTNSSAYVQQIDFIELVKMEAGEEDEEVLAKVTRSERKISQNVNYVSRNMHVEASLENSGIAPHLTATWDNVSEVDASTYRCRLIGQDRSHHQISAVSPLQVLALCPASNWGKVGRACFRLFSGFPGTWRSAEEDCRVKGGYLANILSDNDFISVVRYIKSQPPTKVGIWLGIRDDGNVTFTKDKNVSPKTYEQFKNLAVLQGDLGGIGLCPALKETSDSDYTGVRVPCEDEMGYLCKFSVA